MPLPPRTGRLPLPTGSSQEGWFTVGRRDASGSIITTGPYLGLVVTGPGQIQIQTSPAAPAIMVDALIRLPVDCGAQQRGIVANTLTGTAYEIVDIQTYDQKVEVAVKRSSGAA